MAEFLNKLPFNVSTPNLLTNNLLFIHLEKNFTFLLFSETNSVVYYNLGNCFSIPVQYRQGDLQSPTSFSRLISIIIHSAKCSIFKKILIYAL